MSSKNFWNFSGFLRIFQDFLGLPGIFLDLFGFLRISRNFSGFPRISEPYLGFHGILQDFLQYFRISARFFGISKDFSGIFEIFQDFFQDVIDRNIQGLKNPKICNRIKSRDHKILRKMPGFCHHQVHHITPMWPIGERFGFD